MKGTTRRLFYLLSSLGNIFGVSRFSDVPGPRDFIPPDCLTVPPAAAKFSCERTSRGYTLIEMVMALFITGIVVTAVFSVVLSARATTNKGGRREAAFFYTRQAMDRLKAYVTADPTAAGPGGVGVWTLPGDSCGGCTWALQTGDHDLTSWLPPCGVGVPLCNGAPISAVLTYRVEAIDFGGGIFGSSVTFSMTWNEP
ncbi:MAG: type II secretion system protein [Elusimicrobia bacterium]|nr:type II secretion system protein [Elusimicrobiota bacterium]